MNQTDVTGAILAATKADRRRQSRSALLTVFVVIPGVAIGLFLLGAIALKLFVPLG